MPEPRDGKQLLLDSRDFAHEHRLTSWWCLWSTVVVFALLHVVIAMAPWLAVRIAASVGAGLVMIRLFVIYHDYEHGTILRRSRLAWVLMKSWGVLTLNPPSIWRRSHDHHHKHNAKMYGASIGSFPLMTVEAYRNATPGQRLAYRITRHPLLFVFGYVTVFVYGMCIRSLIANPRLHADSALSLVVHAGVAVGLLTVGVDALLLHLILPGALSAAAGAYLFYAQHNFPEAYIQPGNDWNYVTAAMRSSSYMRMNPFMEWVTGNIGYHHIHHLNHHIPFYRLPETMDAMPEMQNPGTTSLMPQDIARCLSLKVWDQSREKLVPFPTLTAAGLPRHRPTA